MAAVFQDTEAIKLALLEELNNTMSVDGDVRKKAEERLFNLKFTDGYGVYLTEIIVDQTLDLPLRQLASVMLKQYVEASWIEGDESEPVKIVASDQAKKVIKSILPEGLYDANSKIRSVVAYTISSIASYDWPHDWNELFEIIVKCLGGNENSVHGAMRVLIEFTYDLNANIADCGPLILSEVYRIFEADQVYSTKTRACSVEILLSVLKSINAHIQDKNQIAEMINPILPSFVQSLINGLTIPIGAKSSFNLKTEIVRVLTYMVAEMPKFIHPYLVQILPPIYQLLTQMADAYIKMVVNGSDDLQFQSDDEEDDQFNRMILQTFEFVHSIIESKRFRPAVSTVLTDLIYIVIIYMQITEEQVQMWLDDLDKFVEDDTEQGVNFTVRQSGQDLLAIIGEEFNEKMLPALSEALTKHVAVADANRTAGQSGWWKIHEASMFAVGSYKKNILGNETLFNLTEYLNLARNLLTFDSLPFLNGRCLKILSQYVDAKIYNLQMLEELTNNITTAMGPNKAGVLKVSAAKSVYNVCDNLKSSTDEHKQIVAVRLPHFFDGIFSIINQCQSGVLGLLLEVSSAMLNFDSNFAATVSPKVIPLVVTILLKHHDDRFILELVQDIMKALCQNPYCLGPLQEKLVPTLVGILNATGEQAQPAIQDIALNALETIVKCSTVPLSNILMESAFPAAIHCIMRTEDHSVMQSGGECLRAYIFKSPEQVCCHRNGEGLNNIMQVTTMLLNPLNTEHTATFIGRLVITLITKAGNYLGESIDLLLKAVISKMQLVESLSVIMSLVMTFAHLILIQMDAVLNFLSTVPGPTGEPAMNFVLIAWLSRQHLFYGTYEMKVSTMALCKLFEYGIRTKDARLINVQIKEPKQLPSAAARTRSQTATQTEWINVPVLVKIFKLLLNELSNLKEVREATYDSDQVSEEEESGIEDDLLNGSGGGKNFSAFMLHGDGDNESDTDDEEMMQELMQDPIFQGELEETLTKFIQNFSKDEQFQLVKPLLNDVELTILQGIVDM